MLFRMAMTSATATSKAAGQYAWLAQEQNALKPMVLDERAKTGMTHAQGSQD